MESCCGCCCGTLIILGIGIYLIVKVILNRLRISDLEKKAVFITGCDSGFGHELTLRCLANGMPVFAGCLTEKGAEQLNIQSRWMPGKLTTLVLDVRDDESVNQAVKTVEAKLEDGIVLHGIVNNAGISGNAGVDDWLQLQDYMDAFQVNTLGVIRVTHAFKPLIKKSRYVAVEQFDFIPNRGRIVTVTSICSRIALPALGPYTTSKYAVAGYCDTIRTEMRLFGVSVSILEPGFFRTHITDPGLAGTMQDRIWDRCSQATKEEYGQYFFDYAKKKTLTILKYASPHTEWVVDAYFHALTAQFPYARYHIGYDANFFFVPMSMLPTCIQDGIGRIIQNLVAAPKPAAAI